MRKIPFQNDYYYHICNRGVDKREVFCDEKDYLRFLRSMCEFNRINQIGRTAQALRPLDADKIRGESHSDFLKSADSESQAVGALNGALVEIIAYCLNPNHYHLLLKQSVENGISKFMQKLAAGYTWYFNYHNHRSGALFQGKFKAVPITTDEQLLYVSSYINGNAQIHKIAPAENYKWCGYPDYLGKRPGTLCQKKNILKQFADAGEYRHFTDEVIKNSTEIKDELRKCLIE